MARCGNEPIGRLIYRTSLDLRNYAEKLLGPYDLTVEQFHLLKSTTQDEGISQSELCSLLGKKPANITRILDRLEKKGWIERRANPDDRRSSLVFLTGEGQRRVDEVSSTFESYSGWFLDGVDDDDEHVFRRVLATINRNLEQLMRTLNRERK